jgi:hypothetical protein
MKQLAKQQRVAVIRCLVDGVSIRATTRITGVCKNTIQKLTRELREAVLQYFDNPRGRSWNVGTNFEFSGAVAPRRSEFLCSRQMDGKGAADAQGALD